MTKLWDLPTALELAGVTVRTLDGWEGPADPGYYWREADGEPAGHMAHHTASTGYTPNRDKANGWAGLSYKGSDRLYQERYEGDGYEPVFVIANAYPAPISAGAGDINVLYKVRAGECVEGRQGPDTPDWYGNTHYYSTEWVLDGTGSPVDEAVWEMMVLACQVQNDLMEWNSCNHIGHGHHTRRKIDLWNGMYNDFDETIMALRTDMEVFAVWANDITDRTWKTWFDDTTVLGTQGDSRYYSKNDGSVDWEAETGVAWGEGPSDGRAAYGEKIHALNVGFTGFATSIQKIEDSY